MCRARCEPRTSFACRFRMSRLRSMETGTPATLSRQLITEKPDSRTLCRSCPGAPASCTLGGVWHCTVAAGRKRRPANEDSFRSPVSHKRSWPSRHHGGYRAATWPLDGNRSRVLAASPGTLRSPGCRTRTGPRSPRSNPDRMPPDSGLPVTCVTALPRAIRARRASSLPAHRNPWRCAQASSNTLCPRHSGVSRRPASRCLRSRAHARR